MASTTAVSVRPSVESQKLWASALFRTELFKSALAGVAVLWLGSFLGDHWRTARLALPALALYVAALVALAACIRQLVLLSQAGRAARAARRQLLAQARALRAATGRWAFQLSFLLWTPLLLVVAASFLDWDVYAAVGPRVVAANLLGGLLLMDVVALVQAAGRKRAMR